MAIVMSLIWLVLYADAHGDNSGFLLVSVNLWAAAAWLDARAKARMK